MGSSDLQARFETALLHSERRRILLLLSAYAMVIGFAAVRDLARGSSEQLTLLAVITIVGVGHELIMLGLVRRSIAKGRRIPGRVWAANVVVECLVPTFAIVGLRLSGVDPVTSLSAPAVHTYYIFIALSTMHLAPRLGLLAGGVSAGGYLVMVLTTPFADDSQGPPFAIYLTYMVIMLVVGFCAAAVAREIRRHLETALSEAWARSKVERDLDIARSIQSGLLPQDPLTIGEYEIVGRSEPADQTGGDYFDWKLFNEDQVVVSLADVTGHGIGPALIAAVCRAYARATALQASETPTFTTLLNDLLEEDIPDDRFVAFVMGIVDSRKNVVELLAAGHGPVLHVRAGSSDVDRHEAHGMPLGIMPGFAHDVPTKIEMEPGDVLALVTDGLFEQTNVAGEAYGLDRIATSLVKHRGLSAQHLVDTLFDELAEFAENAVQKDDVTAVIIHRGNMADGSAVTASP